jgi:hypothetical protein
MYSFTKTGLGYNVFFSSLSTPVLSITKEVLFVAGGIQTGFIEEQPIVDCIKYIDELHVPHMP